MDTLIRYEIYQKAKEWILEAGDFIKKRINDPIEIDTKSNPNDLVTTLDKETEQLFAQYIKETYPDHLLLGEEGFGDDVKSLKGTIWIIDPIDGTMNFVHQKRNFAISIGVYHDSVGEIGLIYDVMEDVLYSAMKDKGAYKNGIKLPMLSETRTIQKSIIGLNHRWLGKNKFVDERVMQQLVKRIRGSRTYGSAALEFAFVAEGILDGYMAMQLSPWDVAAGIIIVNEVGGRTTNSGGSDVNMLERNLIITSNKNLHELLLNDYIQKGRK